MRVLRRRLGPCPLMLAALVALACDDGASTAPDAGPPEPAPRAQYTVAVMSALQGGGNIEAIDWVAAKINAAGGIGGTRPLVVRYHDTRDLSAADQVQLAEELALDDEVVAVLGPGSPDVMLEIAGMMERVQKPLVSFTSTSATVLRAFGGSRYVWRTTLTDLAQVEVLVRDTRQNDAERIGVLTSLGPAGRTFFDAVPFQARVEGIAPGDVVLETYEAVDEIAPAIDRLFAADLDRIIAAPVDADSLIAIARGLAPHRGPDAFPSTPVVFADTGVDLNIELDRLGDDGRKLTGWQSGHDADSGFDAGLADFIGDPRYPHYSAAAHDALLLVAYGLEAAGGEVGAALADGMARAVAGRGAPFGIDEAGIAGAMAALRAGEDPDISGATGALEYDPEVGVDPLTGTLRQWSTEGPPPPGTIGLPYVRSIRLGDDVPRATLRGGGGRDGREERFRAPDAADADPLGDVGPPTRVVAVIAAVSGGWSNYRHQADALAMYDRLIAGGVHPDDIVFVSPDDVADDPQNSLPGQVFNVPGGPDVYRPGVADYAAVSPADFVALLRGEARDDLPRVVDTDADTNLLIYVVGHGGVAGVSFGAETTSAGLYADADTVLTPTALREALCTLRSADAVRRVLVLVESCHGGVMGDARFGGIEAGCGDAGDPLTGVFLLSAAGVDENSLATGYDRALDAWLGDEFSVAVQQQFDATPAAPLLDLYRAAYLSVGGSHVTAYNGAHYGPLETLGAAEFLYAP